jgi:16S rRNA (uracil1498-N3)-methyltransferase
MRDRALPRVFLPGVDLSAEIVLPPDELDKLRKVLRLSSGALIAVLPDDGTLVRCELRGRVAMPVEVVRPETEPAMRLTIAQALPKGDKLEEIVRACTELGAVRFLLFASERTVVRWDEKKVEDRLRRLRTIAKESAEVSFRTRLPRIEFVDSLDEVLAMEPDAIVLSEVESVDRRLPSVLGESATLVVGPEGGWSPRELKMIGDRGATLGPRVLRVEHAAAAAAAILLLGT